MYTAEKINGFWWVCKDGSPVGTWMVGRMPGTKEQCEDAAQRLNAGATIRDLPKYNAQDMSRIVARDQWGNTYSAQNAEDGYIPSEAYNTEPLEE